MARLFHFHDYVLNGLFSIENTKQVKEALFRVIFDGLEPAYRSLREIRNKWLDDKIPEKEKIQHIENVYSYLTIAFKDRFQLVTKLLGYEIGFLFKNEKDFVKGCAEFLVLHSSIDPFFIETIKNDRTTWSQLMVTTRNNLIDHAAEKDAVLIQVLRQHMSLDAAEKIFDNCWRSIEDYLLVFAVDKTDPKYGHRILELQEYRENKDNPKRVGWFMDKEPLA